MAKLVYTAPLHFELMFNPITAGDGKWIAKPPFDGMIIGSRNGPSIDGCIQHAGTGGGATTIQVRNTTTGRDYFETKPEFRVADADAGNRSYLRPGTLKIEPSFKAGDLLALDVDAVPGGADSAYATVDLDCEFYREVD